MTRVERQGDKLVKVETSTVDEILNAAEAEERSLPRRWEEIDMTISLEGLRRAGLMLAKEEL